VGAVDPVGVVDSVGGDSVGVDSANPAGQQLPLIPALRVGGRDESWWKQVLIRESELRTSEATQRLYAAAESSPHTDWLEVTNQLQRQVLEEFGVCATPSAEPHTHMMTSMLHHLRTITYPTKFPRLAEHALYVKYNRAQAGTLVAGSDIPDAPLYPVSHPSGSGTTANPLSGPEQQLQHSQQQSSSSSSSSSSDGCE